MPVAGSFWSQTMSTIKDWLKKSNMDLKQHIRGYRIFRPKGILFYDIATLLHPEAMEHCLTS